MIDPPTQIQEFGAILVGSLIFPYPTGPVKTEDFFAGTIGMVAQTTGLPRPLAVLGATSLCAWLDERGYIALVGDGSPECKCGSDICGKTVAVTPEGRRWVTSLVPMDSFPSDDELNFDSPPWE